MLYCCQPLLDTDRSMVGSWGLCRFDPRRDPLPSLGVEEGLELDRIKNNRRRLEWLSVRAGVKRLAVELNLAPSAEGCQVVKEVNGRPWLQVRAHGRHRRYPCSLTHKSGTGAFCLPNSTEIAVGVDLEEISEKPWHLRRHFATKYDSLPQYSVGMKYYALLWACKEAASKVMGCGMRIDFTLLKVQGGENRTLNVRCDGWPAIKGTYRFIDGFVLVSLFCRREDGPNGIKQTVTSSGAGKEKEYGDRVD